MHFYDHFPNQENVATSIRQNLASFFPLGSFNYYVDKMRWVGHGR